MDLFQVAAQIRRTHPALYPTTMSDEAVVDDYRRRAPAMGGDDADYAKNFDKLLGALPDYKKKDGIIPEWGGLTTAVKSAINGAGMGLPEAAAQALGTTMFNPGERERNPWASIVGDIGGSVAGFGKIAKTVKGARTGLEAARRMALADAVMGATSGAAREYARGAEEADTNKTGKQEGNPLVGIPGAAGAGLAYGTLGGARLLALKGMIKEPRALTKAAVGLGSTLGAHGAQVAAETASSFPEGERLDAWKSRMSNPLEMAFPLVLGGYQTWGARGRWAGGADAPPPPGRRRGVPGTGVVEAAAPAPPPPPPGADDIARLQEAIAGFQSAPDRELRSLMVLNETMKRQAADLKRGVESAHAPSSRGFLAYDLEFDDQLGTVRKGIADFGMVPREAGRGYWTRTEDGRMHKVHPRQIKSQTLRILGDYPATGRMVDDIVHQPSLKSLRQPSVLKAADGTPEFILIGSQNQKNGPPRIIGLDVKTGQVRAIAADEILDPKAATDFAALETNLLERQMQKKPPRPEPTVGIPKTEPAPTPDDVRGNIMSAIDSHLEGLASAKARLTPPRARRAEPPPPSGAPPAPGPGAPPPSDGPSGASRFTLPKPNAMLSEAEQIKFLERRKTPGEGPGGVERRAKRAPEEQAKRDAVVPEMKRMGVTDAEIASMTDADWQQYFAIVSKLKGGS